uniref:Uncharacterized protein n=1 Tax=Brassica oleracea var. oleracea TaxID=109376 RepID=A0A0D3DDP9_BRAOL
MGILVSEMKKNVSEEITFEQRKELIGGMVKWARAIGLLVKTASEKKGKSIDLVSFGVDYSPHVPSPFKGASGIESRGGHFTRYLKPHPNLIRKTRSEIRTEVAKYPKGY